MQKKSFYCAKLRISERKAKFIWSFPSESNFSEAKVTILFVYLMFFSEFCMPNSMIAYEGNNQDTRPLHRICQQA